MNRSMLFWICLTGCMAAALAQTGTATAQTPAAQAVAVQTAAASQAAAPQEPLKLRLDAGRSGESADERWERIRTQMMAQTALLRTGDALPAFAAERYDGGQTTAADCRGKVVLFCFWGTWCAPCLAELAPDKLPALAAPYADRPDFLLLAAAQDDRAALDRFFAAESRAEYRWLRPATLVDADKALFGCFARRGVPRTVLVGRDGTIVEQTVGNHPLELERLRRALAAQFE